MRAKYCVALAALAVVVVGVLVAAGAGEPKEQAAEATVRVVEIPLGGRIPEQATMTLPFGPRKKLLRDFTASIRKAAKDDEVKAIILRLNHPVLGMAKLQELTDALREFKATNKKVYCYVEACANADYLLACAADRIVAPPGGMVLLTGLSAQVMFYKGLLDWAGIKAEFLTFGKHKTAADPLTRESMSEENRRVFNELLDDLYEQFVGTIAKGRKLTAEKVREAIDNGPYAADEARLFHLVDDVVYYDQFVAEIGKELGGKVKLVKKYHHLGRKGPDLSQFNIFTLFAALQPKPDIPPTKRPKVAIIFATGMITWGRSSWFPVNVITADEIRRAFETARNEPTVKAVVLRIDSPGGSALVSDLIWREVERTRKAGKPVIASMSDVAASGGYYIAMGADEIVAQPATLTGSIGVLGGKLILRGLYDKIGITKETFTRGRNAGVFSDYAGFSEGERKRVRALMAAIYNQFVHKAALGRKIPHERMRKLATGRVWTARAAKKLGLVDALGGLKEAYERAIDRAGIRGQKVQPVILPREKTFLEVLFDPGAHAASRAHSLPLPDPALRALPYIELLELLARENVLTLTPYLIDVR